MKVNFGLSLAPFDRAYAETVRDWRNHDEVWRWCRQLDLITDWEQERWYERQAADPTIRMYAVVMAVEGLKELVGVAGLTSIDHVHRRAEFSLYLRPDFHGKGMGKQALSLLLFHGFVNLGLNVIWGESFEGNKAMKTFEGLGFVKEGVRQQFYFKNGRFIDAHLYSITRQKWQSSLSQRSSSASSSPASSTSPSDSSSGSSSSAWAEDLVGKEDAPVLEALVSSPRPSSGSRKKSEKPSSIRTSPNGNENVMKD
jgi:RimJ/RimL family protein N-acetyltransferase